MKWLALILLTCAPAMGQLRTDRAFHLAALLKAPAAGGGGGFPSGATHHWAFENNLEDAIGAFDLVDNTVQSYPSGKHNLAVRFLNDPGMCLIGGSADSNDNLPFSSAFTVAVWMKYEDGSSLSFVDSGGSLYIQYDGGGDKVNFAIGGADVTITGLADNTWHLFVMVYDGATGLKGSADGSTFSTGTAVGQADNTFSFFCSGTTGQFDEATFWPLQLSQSDVTTLWNGGTGTFP